MVALERKSPPLQTKGGAPSRLFGERHNEEIRRGGIKPAATNSRAGKMPALQTHEKSRSLVCRGGFPSTVLRAGGMTGRIGCGEVELADRLPPAAGRQKAVPTGVKKRKIEGKPFLHQGKLLDCGCERGAGKSASGAGGDAESAEHGSGGAGDE